MSSSKTYVEFIMEQLSQAQQVRSRAMMGAYVIYFRDKVIGGIYDDRFLIKPTEAAKKMLPDATMETPYAGAKEMLMVDQTDDPAFLAKLLHAMYDELPAPKPKKPKKSKDKKIETERLLLRPWADADALSLYRYAKDPQIGPIAGWPVHTSVENSLEILRTVLSAPETYAVVLKETGEPVGSVGIMFGEAGSVAMAQHEAEIGYWIGVPYWGQGLIPEAVQALLKRCFEALDCTAVWCGYYAGNEKSRRVQEKCGFIYHHAEEVRSPLGDLRTEHFTYLTKEQWQKGKNTNA